MFFAIATVGYRRRSPRGHRRAPQEAPAPLPPSSTPAPISRWPPADRSVSSCGVRSRLRRRPVPLLLDLVGM